MNIELKEAAVMQMKKFLQAPEAQGARGIRLSIQNKGCAGHTYHIDYAYSVDECVDQTFEFANGQIIIWINRDTLIRFLQKGLVIDYVCDSVGSELPRYRFTFTNPSAKVTCGCGSSFNVETTLSTEE